jgi:hypothetical protein
MATATPTSAIEMMVMIKLAKTVSPDTDRQQP